MGAHALNATLSAVVTEPGRDERGGVSEALRSAIERTFAATADSAAETRERAGELLDDAARRGQEAREEVSRRGHEAREEVVRRGQEAREAPRAVVDRIGSTFQRLRGGDPAAMQREIDALRKRVKELEKQLDSRPAPKD